MTFFEFIRECLRREAMKVAPDSSATVQKVTEEAKNAKRTDSCISTESPGR